MASKRERKNGTWEYVFKRVGVLKAPAYMTFDTEEEGDRYAVRAEAMLEAGVVPQEMLKGSPQTLDILLGLYEVSVRMKASEADHIPSLRKHVEGVRIARFDYVWVETWVEDMHAAGLAPSTITKKVSGLARVVDWAMRRKLVTLEANPLRQLPRGYGSTGLTGGKMYDGERDRRLEPTEEGAIRSVLADKKEALLFDMALETAMRMSEMLTLKMADIDLPRRTIFLHHTKNGSKRQVPISSTLLKILSEEDFTRTYLFPDWYQGGDKKKAQSTVTHLFARRVKAAGVEDLRFHDLRREATSRIYERTSLSDLEVASITGHKGFRMLQRYSQLRASTLAAKLW